MSVILRSLLLSELAFFMYLTVTKLISERYSENSSSVSSSVRFVNSSIKALIFPCSFALFLLPFIGDFQKFRSYRNCGHEKMA